ncbi:MAG TPA: lipoprotein [Actinomycetota bacterium]|nr:lipoprotein [Actinomycetota bacterium]
MRRFLLGIVAVFTVAGCAPASSEPASTIELLLSPSPTPFTLVTAGQVQGAVPDGWHAALADPELGVRGGFVASPRTGGWPHVDGTLVGMSATWVDATRVGVPSDFYYLAANGPLLSRLTTSANCLEQSHRVYLDRRPTFDVHRRSPGHFMARGAGVCRRGSHATRYAYFVAAPGFGPVHEMGIPSSGLYVVVAVVPAERGARTLLRQLIGHTRFGDDRIRDFVAVAHPAQTA